MYLLFGMSEIIIQFLLLCCCCEEQKEKEGVILDDASRWQEGLNILGINFIIKIRILIINEKEGKL